ncbi:MAG TPA: hypothetical protein VK400_02585 [Pyrinomonadaceae bacterium]|nr:hypothetical protein [Pyrinomonadaceae bacterium]
MKKIISAALILISSGFVFAQQTTPTPQPQQKPLTQAEYVRLLYDLEKNPRKRDEVVEAVRKRGIGFVVTDGIKGLTVTKSRNDAELKRALEEASRRRENPIASQLPSEKESAEVLTKSREATLAAVEEMPDFVVKQMIQRSEAFAGTSNFRNRDRLIVAVSYRSQGGEEYKILSLNGVAQDNPKPRQAYSEVGGTSSTGEFVTVLATIFKAESETRFEVIDTDLIRGRRAVVYGFEIDKDKAKQQITAAGSFSSSTPSGMKGKIWIDRENFRVLRVESAATEIPADFPIRAASRLIDYDWVTISDMKFLLPLLSDVRLTFRENRQLYETRNLIRFKEYQKFGSEVKILDDEEEVPAEEKP